MENEKNYIGVLLDDRYEILEKIGEGGMAVVYKAFCHRLSRFVAVKIMREEMAADEEFKRRFCAESHAIAMLSHPNIVAVYDVSHSDDVEYIVMELVDGITLKQYMDKRGAISWKEALHFTKQITKALAHAHSRGIIHRDIKPQNIMLLKDGTIKVADFGIAALENEMQESGQAVGSIHYIAPEQARGENPDARSDIYSLGIVMYEMLTGRKPYTGETIGEIAVKHMSSLPTMPSDIVPDIPPELERITLKAMSCPINKRYQSANELLDDLDKFTQAQIVQEKKPEYENPAVAPVRSVSEMSREKYSLRRKRSGTVAYMTGVLGGLVLILALFVFLWNFWLRDVFSPAEAAPSSEPTAMPDSAAAKEAAEKIVSAPAPLDEHLKTLLPEGIAPDRIDVISYTATGIDDVDKETELLVCICGDSVLVIARDENGLPVSTMPELTAEQYAALIAPYITAAEDACMQQAES